MSRTAPSRAQRERWRSDALEHLEDFPRQYAALENAMARFGDDFQLERFAAAFTTHTDLDAYNRVQAVERGVGRLQNYVGELALDGVRLAELHLGRRHVGSHAHEAFEALRRAGVIDARLAGELTRAQHARSTLEHGYVSVSAADLHAAALLVHRTAREFITVYRRWIAPYLQSDDGGHPGRVGSRA